MLMWQLVITGCVDPPLAPDTADLSLSLEQHRADSHSTSVADCPSGNGWRGQSLPAAEKEQKNGHFDEVCSGPLVPTT